MHDRSGTFSRTFGLPMCGLFAAAFSACETVIVSTVEVSKVEVIPASIMLVEGRSDTAVAVVRETGGVELAGRTVTWTVDDSLIATVTADGVVEGRAPGTTQVHASSDGVSGLADVTVLADEDESAGACNVSDRFYADDVTIPEGVSCIFTDVEIRGRLEVSEGSRLVASRLTVAGAFTANGAEEVVLTDSRIYGELRSEKGGAVTIRSTYVEKKVQIRDNLGTVAVSDTHVEETLDLENNRGGPFTLLRNQANRLECKDNNPAPTGSGNVATSMTGQCRDL